MIKARFRGGNNVEKLFSSIYSRKISKYYV